MNRRLIHNTYPVDVLSSSFVDKVIVIIETCRVVSKLSNKNKVFDSFMLKAIEGELHFCTIAAAFWCMDTDTRLLPKNEKNENGCVLVRKEHIRKEPLFKRFPQISDVSRSDGCILMQVSNPPLLRLHNIAPTYQY